MPAQSHELISLVEVEGKRSNTSTNELYEKTSDEILDGPNSIITQQASNRVWAAQAVLSEILHANGLAK